MFYVQRLTFKYFWRHPYGWRLILGVYFVNIEEKLELVKNSKVIVGIKEGMFVRFYEQSLFGWQQWVSTQPNPVLTN